MQRVWRWHRDLCPRHVKSRILSQISAVRQTWIEHPISSAPVNKIYKLPHTNDKGRSDEEILQRDHGLNREDLGPMSAWTWPLSALPRARRRAQAAERALALPRACPERVSEQPSAELTHALKTHHGRATLHSTLAPAVPTPSLALASSAPPAKPPEHSATVAKPLQPISPRSRASASFPRAS
jgi:hypothetical protein